MPRFALHSLARLLRAFAHRTWLVAAVTVVCCAALAANAATAIVDADYLASAPPDAPRPVPRPVAPSPARPALDGGQLVARNMFCSSCQPASAPDLTPGFALEAADLIATEISLEARATVRVLASHVQGSWGIGEAIPGLGQVERIGPTWIDVVHDGHRGRLSLRPATGDVAPGDPPLAPPGPSASACGPAADAWIDRIRKLDEQNYEVDRELVRELVSGVTKAGRMRPVPILENGEIKGIRLLGIARCSIASMLGLQNGDTLAMIDGAPFRNAQQLLDLYARLDQLTAVEFAGTRAGKPLVRTLRVR